MPRRARLAQPKERRKAAPVLRVDERVSKEAFRLAEGDATRIKIINAETVLVINKGKR